MGRQYLFYPHLLAFHLAGLPTKQQCPRVRCPTRGRLSVRHAFQDSLILLKSLLTASGACSTLVTYFTKAASCLKACTTYSHECEDRRKQEEETDDMTTSRGEVVEPARTTKVCRETEVLVVGGGPAGVAATVAAARNGADTTLIERYNHLGGMATGGLVILSLI